MNSKGDSSSLKKSAKNTHHLAKRKLSNGAVIGIVVAAIFGVGLLIWLLSLVTKKTHSDYWV